MPYSLEQKNVLIVPLSLFIRFNKKMAGEQFANLFGKFFDDMFSCDEEMQAHENFCENLLQKILTSQIVADFNLGKKTQRAFIAELLSFLNLPSDKSIDIKNAWNSLMEFDRESSNAFDALIHLTQQGKSIYFIGETNELHAKKILDLFKSYPYNKLSFLENLPEKVQALPVAVSQVSNSELGDDAMRIGTIYFCLSYAYKTLIEHPQNVLTKLFTAFKPTSGLITHLKLHLNEMGKTKDEILLINPQEKDYAIAKKLALETLSKENFYTALLGSSGIAATATCIPLQILDPDPALVVCSARLSTSPRTH
ncbi:hypothetical protein [Rickettsiella endosymbiont of Miltochrista miniata]|uniref:hypothetical protein n=1 Tax=Rickettsiella endosymbiont of Miltochrista miniata TaxID=3066239 RepID=UPI00313DA9EB